MNINKNSIFIQTTSQKHSASDFFKLTTTTGLMKLQCHHDIPKFLYIYESKKFQIYQISPYKLIKTYNYKNEVLDFTFSPCGNYLLTLNTNQLRIYDNNGVVAKVEGNFEGCKIQTLYKFIVVSGNYKYFVFEFKNNENNFFEIKRKSGIEFGLNSDGLANDHFLTRNCTANACFDELHLTILDRSNIKLRFPCEIHKVLLKTILNKAYCLCVDKRVYVSNFDGTKPLNTIDQLDVLGIRLSFDERVLIVWSSKCVSFYDTSCDMLIDEVEFEGEVFDVVCALNAENDINLMPICLPNK